MLPASQLKDHEHIYLCMQVRGTQSVVDCLLDYATKHKAGLIVMGSQQVTKGDAALASSITLAVLKRTDAPVVVTKPSTPAPMGCLSGGLRAMLAVEHTARPLLKWLNSHLITVTRGDKLYLARVGAKDAKAQVRLKQHLLRTKINS